ncbi:hypothetical protein [Massilia phosphatilytica]
MRADFGSLFQHADRDIGSLAGGELLEPDRGGQPGRAAADDDHIVFHRLALPVLFGGIACVYHDDLYVLIR